MELTSTDIFWSVSKDFMTISHYLLRYNILVNNYLKSSWLWHKYCDLKLAPSKLKILLGNSSQVNVRGGTKEIEGSKDQGSQSLI